MYQFKRFLLWLVLALMLCCLLGACTRSEMPSSTSLGADSSLEVHFIDVGQADATLILCDEQAMLIDGGNVEDSDLIVAYLQKLEVSYLDYVVCTHAHEDHVGGLSGALHYAEAGQVFCPVTSYDSTAFENFANAVSAQDLELCQPEVGEIRSLGSATWQILGPQRAYENTNDTSIALRLVYGQTSFLFTGDAEWEAEHDIVEARYDLSSTVLQVGHHGSDTSSAYVFLREVMPAYAVISVGQDNSYGHPSEATLSRLRDVGATVYRTDLQGDILCISDGEEVYFETARKPYASTNPTQVEPQDSSAIYVGNVKSLKFHRDTCSNLPVEKNRVYLTKAQALEEGYSPCGNCNP